jgi:MarR family transcriptional regulator, organic hydroperoxide resistance regulator
MATTTRKPRAQDTTRLPNVLEFMQQLWAVIHGVERASKRMSTEIGVTGTQRLVLRVVGLFPELSAGELATILRVHPSTLTGVLRRLSAQRLLQRVDDGRDRRRVVLRLTPRGTRLNAVHSGTVEASVGAALRGVAAREQNVTRRVLSRIAEHLDPPAPSTSRSPRASRRVKRPSSRSRKRA